MIGKINKPAAQKMTEAAGSVKHIHFQGATTYI